MGGVIAQLVYHRHAPRVRSLILADTNPGGAAAPEPERSARVRQRLEALDRLGPRGMAEQRAPNLVRPGAPPDLIAELASIMAEVRPAGYCSAAVALGGITLGWWFYSRRPVQKAEDPDPLEQLQPETFAVLRGKFFIDEFYELSVVRFNAWSARTARWLDDKVWGGLVTAVSSVVLALAWLNRLIDEFVVNLGFDKGCGSLRGSGSFLARIQNGQVQRYLRIIGLALAATKPGRGGATVLARNICRDCAASRTGGLCGVMMASLCQLCRSSEPSRVIELVEGSSRRLSGADGRLVASSTLDGSLSIPLLLNAVTLK